MARRIDDFGPQSPPSEPDTQTSRAPRPEDEADRFGRPRADARGFQAPPVLGDDPIDDFSPRTRAQGPDAPPARAPMRDRTYDDGFGRGSSEGRSEGRPEGRSDARTQTVRRAARTDDFSGDYDLPRTPRNDAYADRLAARRPSGRAPEERSPRPENLPDNFDSDETGRRLGARPSTQDDAYARRETRPQPPRRTEFDRAYSDPGADTRAARTQEPRPDTRPNYDSQARRPFDAARRTDDFERAQQSNFASRSANSDEIPDSVALQMRGRLRSEDRAQRMRLQTRSYDEMLDMMIDLAHLSGWETTLDAGCGDGRFAARLAENCRFVVAMDTSTQMLDKSVRTLRAAGIRNFDALQGDARRMPIESNTFDVVFLNMLLHHVVTPQQVPVRGVPDPETRRKTRCVRIDADRHPRPATDSERRRSAQERDACRPHADRRISTRPETGEV